MTQAHTHRSPWSRRRFIAGASGLVAVTFAGAACSDDDDPADALTASEKETVRYILQRTPAADARGFELVLSRLVMPPGGELKPHTHPGLQSAVIHQGSTVYTVHTDTLSVTRKAASTSPGNPETIPAGQTLTLTTGDAFTEPKGMVHSLKNTGKTPLVLFLSSLFPEGAPPSSPATVN